MVMKSSIFGINSMTPSSVSPVLKTKIDIVLDSGFPYALNKGDITVNATSTNAETPDYVRYLNVIAVDDSSKKLTVMFGGALSGDFQMSVRHKTYGLINCANKILQVGSTVTSFTP